MRLPGHGITTVTPGVAYRRKNALEGSAGSTFCDGADLVFFTGILSRIDEQIGGRFAVATQRPPVRELKRRLCVGWWLAETVLLVWFWVACPVDPRRAKRPEASTR